MGWTNPANFTAGTVLTAATLNEQLVENMRAINGYVPKTADESVTSSAVLQNDDHLLYSIAAAGTYAFEVHIYAVSAANAAGDIQVGFSFPTGTCYFAGLGPHNQLASGSNENGEWLPRLSATSGVTNIPYGLSTAGGYIQVHGLLVATATGTLRFMWSQMASSASATTVKAGSHMIVKQVA